jgi:type I restriction enzyme S subunit
MIDFAIHPSDLIISCSGTIGKVVKVPENVRPGIINQALLKITPLKNIIISDFLKFVIEISVIQERLTANTRGSTIRNIASVKEIKRIKIPLPPIETQQKIVERLSAVQNYKKKLLDQKQKLQELFESVLSKSFKRELIK